MDKLYKLARAAGGSFSCYGAKFGVRTNDPALLRTIAQSIPLCARPTNNLRPSTIYSFLSPPLGNDPRVRRFYLLYENARLIKRGRQGSELFETFENSVNLHISENAFPYVFIHASVVAWNNHAIVIPGPSQSGKSTLASAFLRLGATYFSDEFAVFDRRGRVHPFPRPISLRSGDGTRTKYAAEQLGAATASRPLPVGMVIVTRYRESARWKPSRISRGRTMLSLLANSMSARRRPRANMKILSDITQSCASVKGIRGEADEVAESVFNNLRSHHLKFVQESSLQEG